MLINSPNISGSLKVTGNTVITGSLTVVGGINATIQGTATTASYVQYTNVANKPTLVSGSSQVSFTGITNKPTLVSGSGQISFTGITNKPSLVSGSSQISYSGVSSKPSGIVSSSVQVRGYSIFATTGSNQFKNNQVITGSLTVTGQVIAQTLNVQQVTSSIVFSSGSNRFGNNSGNTHQFTGSVSVTGGVTVNGAGTFSSAVTSNSFISDGTANEGVIRIERDTVSTNTVIGALNFTNNNGATVYGRVRGGRNSAGDGYVSLGTGVGENLYALEGGNVGIGTTSPTGRLMLYQSSAGNVFLNIVSNQGSSIQAGINFSPSMTDGEISTNPAQASIYATDSNYGANIIFSTKATGAVGNALTERMRITSGGNVFINNSSGVTLNDLTNRLSVSSTTYNLFDISRFSDNAFGPNFYLVKSRNGSIGGNTIVANGDNLGNISWLGANGTGFTDAASIKAEVDGTPGASDMPGRLVFSTTADGTTNNTERMRITSGGNVGIGTSDVQGLLDVYKSNSGGLGGHIVLRNNGAAVGNEMAVMFMDGGTTNVRAAISSTTEGDPYFGDIKFKTGLGTYSSLNTRMTIKGEGNVGIGTTDPQSKFDVTNIVGTAYDASNTLISGQTMRIANTSGVSGISTNLLLIATGAGGGNGLGSISGVNTGTGSLAITFGTRHSGGSVTEKLRITSTGIVHPGVNGTQDLGTSSLRWATVFTSDLSLSNGIGDYTIVEGENDLFLYNNKQNKVYKFVIEEVDPSTATPKKS